jgi:hypothetical protein
MDKDRAFTEIQSILGHTKNQNLTYEEQIKLIREVLQSLSAYDYQRGFKNGMNISASLITDFIKKELS